MGVNRCIFIGNLGADPESKNLDNDTIVCNFSIAVSESWTKDGEKHEKTEWVKIVTWGKLAEICQNFLVKGKQVYIEGKLQTRSWESDGVTKYMTEVVASQMQMLGSKEEKTAEEAPPF